MIDNIKAALKLRNWVNVAHHIPGRIRLKYKLSIMLHLARFNFKEIEQALESIPALHHYKINRTTGSIVIEYDPQRIIPALLEDIFSDDESTAEAACYTLAENLNLDGVR